MKINWNISNRTLNIFTIDLSLESGTDMILEHPLVNKMSPGRNMHIWKYRNNYNYTVQETFYDHEPIILIFLSTDLLPGIPAWEVCLTCSE